jgi:hypothetical protein
MAGMVAAAVVVGVLLAYGTRPREEAPEEGPALTDVLTALRREGIHYDVAETAVLPSIGAEGVRLVGPRLEMEVYSIPSRAGVAEAVQVAEFLAAAHAEGDDEPFIRGFVRAPFFIVVRQEPNEGLVGGVVDRVFSQPSAEPGPEP